MLTWSIEEGGGVMLRGTTGKTPVSRRTAHASALFLGAWLVVGLLTATGAEASTAPSFVAVGSAEQVYVTGLAPYAQMSLMAASGQTLSTQSADSLGGLLFRNVPPAKGYRVLLRADGTESGRITVHSDRSAPWDPSVYRQTIPDNGYTYLTTRDGTKLAIDVHPPTSPAGEPGLPSGTSLPNGPDFLPPYPTLIEYSGYGYADPAGPVNGIAVLANLMGFAVVDVNMRGTGCSGGAYDFFETLQNLDGYDVIETIAHQPWVLDHKVGMMGISYGAISQLFTAQLRPPDLEAISPLSTLDTTATTLYPGGVLNSGFAVAWAQQRQAEAEPAGPTSGQPWAYTQIQSGDKTCLANQVLHGEAADLSTKIAANAYYNSQVADPLDPITFVKKIKVPVFMACQWEDEQTGGHCPDLVQHFTGTNQKWFTFTNGAHIDSIDPYTYDRWYDFLELFVAHQAPIVNSAISRAACAGHLPDGHGTPAVRSRHPAGGPDPGTPDVPVGTLGLRAAPEGAGALRQRRWDVTCGDRDSGRSVSRIRARLLDVSRPGHDHSSVVSRTDGDAGRPAAGEPGCQLVLLERERRTAHRLREQHWYRRLVGKRFAVAMELGAESRRQRCLLRVNASDGERHRRRLRRCQSVGALVDPRRRPSSHHQRSPSGR